MKKLPYGISNYEELITENYYYVDKTKNIEKLEDLAEKRILFLRPRKFGKTLFTSMISYYYDINAKNKFEKLFKNTYIGKNPTPLKNSYCILKFNFSGIDTTTAQTTVEGFKETAKISIQGFIADYNIDFYVNDNQTAEDMLNSLLESFRVQRRGQKIYVIIDEYDHFANELLGFHTEDFKNLVSKNGKVRKWYEILKKGTETVVDRIFITGVAPITLDSLTSGFNIGKDITQDFRFNEMMGFTKEELANIMKSEQIEEKEQEKILPIMKQSYDGYKFSIDGKEKIYNSNMCLYFLNEYKAIGDVPRQLIDVNIASDYSKLGKMLDLCKGEERRKVIEDTVAGKEIASEITQKFNPAMEFTEKDLVSMLFYLGYLTIVGQGFSKPKLQIPNDVIRKIYSDYFLGYTSKRANIQADSVDTEAMNTEMLLEGKIGKILEELKMYLTNLSNRDYTRFDEKYVKLIFYALCKNLGTYLVKSELEISSNYSDVILIPRINQDKYYGILIEFKYIKKEDYEKNKDLLVLKQEEAKKQLEKYKKAEEVKILPNLKAYAIVAIKDELHVEEV